MSKKKRQHSPEFKAKIALAAIKNEETISALAARFGVHPTMVNNWKRSLVDGAAAGSKTTSSSNGSGGSSSTSISICRASTTAPNYVSGLKNGSGSTTRNALIKPLDI